MLPRLTSLAALAVLVPAFLNNAGAEYQTAYQPQPSAKTLPDCSPQELLARYPQLVSTWLPAEDQQLLPSLLSKVGIRIEEFTNNFPNTTCSEAVLHESVDPRGSIQKQSQKCRYVIVGYPHMVTMDEYRTDRRGSEIKIRSQSDRLFLTSGYATLPLLLHPAHQSGSRFRYLGTTSDPKCHLIAFAQVPFMAKLHSQFTASPSMQVVLYNQGLIWVDQTSHQIVRMRTELLQPATQIGLEELSADLDFRPVAFEGSDQAFWLPYEVKVLARYGYWTFRNRHEYSDYKRFSVNSFDKVTSPKPLGPASE